MIRLYTIIIFTLFLSGVCPTIRHVVMGLIAFTLANLMAGVLLAPFIFVMEKFDE